MVKKKQDLSLEETLGQALVPESEQPYKLPDNWVWTRLGDILTVSSGKSLTASKMNSDGQIPVYGGNGVTGYHDASNLEAENIVIGRVGFYCGSVHYIYEPSWITDNALIVSFERKYINIKFLFWLLRVLDLRKNDSSTAQPVISGGKIYSLETPLPPLVEQQRIVERIESLFEKLDQAKGLIQDALDSFENRKAAILHKAFSGELSITSGYEKVNILSGVEKVKNDLIQKKIIQRPKKVEPIVESDIDDAIPKTWQICKLGQIAFVTKLAGFEYTKYINLNKKGEIPVIRAQNVRKGYLDITNLLYIDEETSLRLNRSALYKDCLLITFIGAGIGDVCIFDDNQRFHLAPNVAKVELYNDDKEYVLTEYILYYLLSSIGQKQIFKHIKATAQPSLSMETIRDIVVPLPSVQEQIEIVHKLNSLFAKEQNANELCDLIDKIDLIKKAILARAFRGVLGTNDPSEESAIELLKEMLAR